MVTPQLHVLRLQFPLSQPPQSDLHTHEQLWRSAVYLAPQPSAAASQAQPHVDPSFTKTWPGGQL